MLISQSQHVARKKKPLKAGNLEKLVRVALGKIIENPIVGRVGKPLASRRPMCIRHTADSSAYLAPN